MMAVLIDRIHTVHTLMRVSSQKFVLLLAPATRCVLPHDDHADLELPPPQKKRCLASGF